MAFFSSLIRGKIEKAALREQELSAPYQLLLVEPNPTDSTRASVNVVYVARNLSHLLKMSTEESHRSCIEANKQGVAVLGTWSKRDCMALEHRLQQLEIMCRSIPAPTDDGGIVIGKDVKTTDSTSYKTNASGSEAANAAPTHQNASGDSRVKKKATDKDGGAGKREKNVSQAEGSSENGTLPSQYHFNIGGMSYSYSPSDEASTEDAMADNKEAPTIDNSLTKRLLGSLARTRASTSSAEDDSDDDEARDDPRHIHRTRSTSSTNTRHHPPSILIEI